MKIRVRIDAEFFEVEVGDLDARPVLATVAGQTFEVWPEEEAGRPSPAPALSVAASSSPSVSPASPSVSPSAPASAAAVPAPIPGVILSISVTPGDSVVFGQELCVLEAMKMKNIIRASRAGVIAEVCVNPGDQVRHGQALLKYTD